MALYNYLLLPCIATIALDTGKVAGQICVESPSPGAPVITVSANPSEAVVDSGVVITCTTSTRGRIKLFDSLDEKLPSCGNNTRCTWKLDHVQSSDAGKNYTCWASSEISGKCSYKAISLVVKKPAFVIQPTNHSAAIGSTVTLRCAVRETNQSVQWLKDGRVLVKTDHGEQGTVLLNLQNITRGDYGIYQCMVENPRGRNEYSRKAFVMPIGPQVTFVIQPKNQSVAIGSSVTLKCAATGTSQSIQWLKDGQVFAKTDHGEQGTVQLNLENITQRDFGTYQCMVENPRGRNEYSQKAFVMPIGPQFTFVIQPKNQSVAIGSSVTLKCAATGTNHSIQWLKDGQVFAKTDHGEQGIVQLNLENITQGDYGIYQCMVENLHGQNEYSQKAFVMPIETGIVPISTQVPPESSSRDENPIQILPIALGLGVGFVVLVIVVVLGVILIRRCRRSPSSPQSEIGMRPVAVLSAAPEEENDPESRAALLESRETRPTSRDSNPEQLEKDELDGPGRPDNSESVLIPESKTATVSDQRGISLDENWEIVRDRLEISPQELGSGEFGVVKKGLYRRRNQEIVHVAVKMSNERCCPVKSKEHLLSELEILKCVGRHPNLVNLVGFWSSPQDLYIVTEFVSGGSLLDRLRSSCTKSSCKVVYVNLLGEFDVCQLTKFAIGIASGMRHLEEKGFIHRDLAARNVLVCNNLEVKVADFGLARYVSKSGRYTVQSSRPLPWKWMALESFESPFFTNQSDIWSFGIVLWEIFTLGDEPYSELSNYEQLKLKLSSGYRMAKPDLCCEEIYALMRGCWNADPAKRPPFAKIHEQLKRLPGYYDTVQRRYQNISEESTIIF